MRTDDHTSKSKPVLPPRDTSTKKIKSFSAAIHASPLKAHKKTSQPEPVHSKATTPPSEDSLQTGIADFLDTAEKTRKLLATDLNNGAKLINQQTSYPLTLGGAALWAGLPAAASLQAGISGGAAGTLATVAGIEVATVVGFLAAGVILTVTAVTLGADYLIYTDAEKYADTHGLSQNIVWKENPAPPETAGK